MGSENRSNEDDDADLINHNNNNNNNKKGDASSASASASAPFLHKFKLYETRSNFYMIGWNKNSDSWKVLKIDRSEPCELDILEDPTNYSDIECRDLLRRIHEGNKSTGGLKFVTMCYGIVGFIKFLGPYYMLLITKRRKIGRICGHAVYAISRSEMIPIPNSTVRSNMDFSKNENRYKKLLCSVDLTKDFYFSYSYRIMHSLQKNLYDYESGQTLYDTMFVWNEFLTRGIRNHLKNSLWTVALVYGFFKQVKLSISGRELKLTLIARRSRHYAGTRYLKRGVNEKGRVANDVETEQIVFEDLPDGSTMQISSVVQNRGSIPLYWSQETSRLNIKPDIILSNKDQNYQATRLHFENLVRRYGKPIIILNLIKTQEKKPRESILRAEFAFAISLINKDLTEDNRLKFLHWDLNKYSKIKQVDVLSLLCKVAAYALNYTGFFSCRLAPTSGSNGLFDYSPSKHGDGGNSSVLNHSDDLQGTFIEGKNSIKSINGKNLANRPIFQRGVLRTNCIDCLDRTNVAQYAFGLVALGQQLHTLGFINDTTIDLDSPLADDIMRLYETMGDTLALQYGGSAAHNKIFCQRRGQWKAATQSQELFRTLQRYYSNVYMDFEKQDAINVFLGYFQPQSGKPALWELNSDQHYVIGRQGSNFADENERTVLKRSLSDGNILVGSNSVIEEKTDVGQTEYSKNQLSTDTWNVGGRKGISESTPEISTCETDFSYPRYTPSMSTRQLFPDIQLDQSRGSDFVFNNKKEKRLLKWSNFLDMDLLSSSGNSWEEDAYERSTLISSSPVANLSSDSIATISKTGSDSSLLEPGSSLKNPDVQAEYSERFVNWVTYGELFH